MAAISATSSIIGLVVNLFIGVSLGANVTIAYAVGRDDKQAVSRAVHTAIVMAVLGGVLAAVLGELAAAPLLWALHTPEDVLPLSLLYLSIYFAGLLVSLLYNFEAAIFRSIGETKIPLIALASSGVLNVLLNLFFCGGPSYDGGRRGYSYSSLQIQGTINSLGTVVMAASGAAFNIEIITYDILNSFSQACTTFVGQNYGAGEIGRCKKTLRLCLGEALRCWLWPSR